MDVKKIAVIGAGVMGRGIAQTAALTGFEVIMNDIEEEALIHAYSNIEKDLKNSVEKGLLTQFDMKQALSNIKLMNRIDEAGHSVDLAIEAAVEIMEVKQDIFKQLDEFCPSHAILATNTSTMSPTEIGAVTKRASQTIAMHFFNPVPKMKLCEIIRGIETSDSTVSIAVEVANRMGKETVQVNEFPGFVPSRINALVGNEALNMLMEGVASAGDIDKAIKLGLNYPMGPLELMDVVGLDTRLRNLEYLHKYLGEKYRPCPLLYKFVAAGRLGKKVGRGIFEYGERV
ncbi:3-hydroxyacyl-CoA dehydrogenase [Brevibacillus fluminis]|uniref:3-hydroxyacyl-CoA dehydrogenase n=1 Tax=Brevibacillus fluminis TaxID=511487 RepID=A0A3M8DHP4_9BACL|nr:3-hydroxyacyl-CoA dehydrogenase NAD-binding domain-containing protein [Brevibacillus fluminis]RNB87640.1 3-hydroxyacyl-CoA dehydrogenase [Brevibacillus fluminis]